ncbi:endonuclease/exonuclease/phosphatase family protein [Pseudactinotalea terrae]|uniref:endonuclease/exonuclease/phosphatase family protein n=1 Tax=Pseudactinotalea terrae TaxID=1743262 RepID=UPI0012E223BE|nr:endonuclease/exonuclease/phosphatase family protein [Pseudactinotalea terrae]
MTRLLTLNLQHGLSRAGARTSADELAAAVAGLEVDVVALQEVDRGQPRSGGIDQARVVADALGLPHVRFAATLAGDVRVGKASPERWGMADGAAYGLAVASRWPVVAWFVKRLPRFPVRHPILRGGSVRLRDDEQRGAVAAVVQTPHGPLTVASAHLSLLGPVAAWQVGSLLRSVSTLPPPAVVAGDLNLDPWALRPLSLGWRMPRALTFPAGTPRRQIDHVLTRGIEIDRADAVDLAISDHRGLLATLTHDIVR